MGLFWAFLMEKWHLNIIKNFPTYLSRSASVPSSLSSSLFVLSHRMVRKHNPSHKLMLTGTGSFLILHLRHYVRLGRNTEYWPSTDNALHASPSLDYLELKTGVGHKLTMALVTVEYRLDHLRHSESTFQELKSVSASN